MKCIIELSNKYSIIKNLHKAQVIIDLDLLCSYLVKGFQFTTAYQKGNWDGRNRLFDKRNNIVPTGMLSIIVKYFDDNNIDYEIKDIRKKPKKMFSIQNNNFILRDYQKQAVEKALEVERGRIVIATGGGKTLVALEILRQLGVKSLFVVNTKEALYDTYNMAVSFFGDENVKNGNISNYSKTRKVGDFLTLTTMAQIVANYKKANKDLSNVEAIVIDECHHSGATSWYESIMLSNSYYRFGLTATNFRTDGGSKLLLATTGKTIVNINANTLQKLGYLVKADINIYELNEPKELDTPLKYHEIYDKGIVYNDTRNNVIVDIVKRNLGKSILVVVEKIEHGIVLENLIKQITDCVYINGNSKNREEIKKKFADGDIKVVIATRIYNESVDIPILEVVINASGGMSGIKVLQRIGRALRLNVNKQKSQIWDFLDNFNVKLQTHSYQRIKYMKKEKHSIKFVSKIGSRSI